MVAKQQPNIEIYTKEWCPFCRKAKAFFKSKGLNYIEYNIDDRGKLKEMINRSDGKKTVPQIFINDQNIDGFDKLMEMKTSGKLSEEFGISTPDYSDRTWDVIIIGAGPAGLTAAVYAVRKGLSTLVVATALGGQILETDVIDNYMASYNISGPELIDAFWDHVQHYDVKHMLGEEVETLDSGGQLKQVKTASGKQLTARSVIVASGSHKRHLRVPGEAEHKGKGVHYCAICDGYLYAGQPVAIVGGGNSGLEACLDMAKLDSRVHLVEISDTLMGDQVLQKKVRDSEMIDIYTSHVVEEIKGDEQVESVLIRNNETGEFTELGVDAVFVEIGLLPNSGFVEEELETTEQGEIVIDSSNATSSQGIWAAGDVTNIKDKQIMIAAAEGVKAALRVNEYLNE
ncbi:MAG: FAD-dependent oxidoreductase [Bacillota bacterium]